MEKFKEEINHHPHEPLLDCISHLRLGFENLKGRMEDSRHLEVRNPFSFLDDPFSMSSSQLKEKLLLSADPRPHWFWRTIDGKEILWRDFIRGALQHIME